MAEEAEALLHSSKSMNRMLKTLLTMFLLVVITVIQFLCLEAVIGTLTTVPYFFGMLFDNVSLLVTMVTLGLYTDLPDQMVQIFGAMPFLLMIFFSTTFSPGAGVGGIKALRYLFSRFYLWCMLPVDIGMEGCPTDGNTLLYLILSSMLTTALFVAWKVASGLYKKMHHGKASASRREAMKSRHFAELQLELFGDKAMRNLKHVGSNHDLQKLVASHKSSKQLEVTMKDTEETTDDDISQGGFDKFMSFLEEGNGKADEEKLDK